MYKTLKNKRDINEYKTNLKNIHKPQKYKFYYHGSIKAGCSYVTHLRVGRSVLNGHAYSIGLWPSPQCQCHAPRESPEHLNLNFFLCNQERLTLMSKVETLLSKFGNFTEKAKVRNTFIWNPSR